jgi:hypothetical protein
VYGSMPGSLAHMRAYRDRFVPGRLTATRGCRMPYPAVTRCVFVVARAIQRVRHGAHNCRAESRGQLRIGVQGDDVLHVRQTGRVADDEREAIPAFQPPRRSAFKSASLPRLRS